MGGGLASVRGLEEVELTQVRRIVLESGAFSGGQLKHVSGEILQRSEKWLVRGWVKFVPALA